MKRNPTEIRVRLGMPLFWIYPKAGPTSGRYRTLIYQLMIYKGDLAHFFKPKHLFFIVSTPTYMKLVLVLKIHV